uniref:Coiled-coil domain-containing protein 22 homolog n=1 Tax=Syphacia muris TaxID=451379 RepID=A0A0N5B065_9BILA
MNFHLFIIASIVGFSYGYNSYDAAQDLICPLCMNYLSLMSNAHEKPIVSYAHDYCQIVSGINDYYDNHCDLTATHVLRNIPKQVRRSSDALELCTKLHACNNIRKFCSLIYGFDRMFDFHCSEMVGRQCFNYLAVIATALLVQDMALDMVDRLIFDTFLKLNKSFFDYCNPPNTLDDLSREQLFEGTVLLLWKCNPETRSVLTSTKLPHNMTLRFRAAMNVADTIKNIGVRDEISYHTLLYGKAKELRNVLVGLIEKLPNKTLIVKKEESPTTLLIRKALSSGGRNELDSSTTRYCLNGQHWKPPWGICKRLPFFGSYGIIDEAFKHPLDWQRMVLCATLESGYSVEKPTLSAMNVEKLCKNIKEDNNDLTKSAAVRKPKPPVRAKKPQVLVKSTAETDTKENIEKSEELLFNAIRTEASEITARISEKRVFLEEQRELELERLKKLESLKNEAKKIDPRLLKMVDLPNVLKSVAEYVGNVAEVEKRAQELQNKWLSVKMEKDTEIRKARQLYDEKLNGGPYLRKIKEFKKSIAELNDQLPVKEAKLNDLVCLLLNF